jgi:hypothetical protein
MGFRKVHRLPLPGPSLERIPLIGGCRTSATARRVPTVPVEELDAGFFEGLENDVKRRATRLVYSALKLTDSDIPNTGLLGQLLLAPIEQAACCSALARRNDGYPRSDNHVDNKRLVCLK